jgi:hypothetical protein
LSPIVETHTHSSPTHIRETELPSELQSHFSCLSDAQIEEIFEVHPIRERLTQELAGLKTRLAKCEENLKSFTTAASSFSNSFNL